MDRVTVMPRERRRAHRFALAVEGAPVHDPALAPMVRLAEALGTRAGPLPSEEFRSALRRRLLAVATVSAASSAASSAGATVGGVSVPRPPSGQPSPWRRHLVAAGAALAVTTGGAATTAVASTNALPGDALYDVKRTIESVQLALATSELAEGERHLQIAATRLDEIAGMLRESGPNPTDPVVVQELRKALGGVGSSTELGSERLFAAYQGTADPAVLQPLDGFLREQWQDLDQLAPLLPPELLDPSQELMTSFQRIAAQLVTVTGGKKPAGGASSGSSSAASPDQRPGGGPRDLPPLPGLAGTGGQAGAGSGTASGAVPDPLRGSGSDPLSHPLPDPLAGGVDAASAVPSQGLAGLDVQPGEGGHGPSEQSPGSPGIPSGSGDLPSPAPNASVGVNSPTAGEAPLLGVVPAPTVSADAPLPGGLDTRLDPDLGQVGSQP